MIRLVVKKKLYDYERVIFPKKKVESKCDIVRYMRFYEQPQDFTSVEWDTYRTPITDLSLSIDEIRSSYSKTVRQEVNRSGRENIDFLFWDSLDITHDYEIISDVEQKYFQFCDQLDLPDMKKNLNPHEFEQMIREGSIVISKAEFEGGWTYHVYQVDGECAMLWFSFSDYRKEGANRSMASWANRGLHHADITRFKDMRYQIYDWGNISSEVEPNQIDKFKMGFGGELKTVYCCFVGNTLKGKILIWLRMMKGKWQK